MLSRGPIDLMFGHASQRSNGFEFRRASQRSDGFVEGRRTKVDPMGFERTKVDPLKVGELKSIQWVSRELWLIP